MASLNKSNLNYGENLPKISNPIPRKRFISDHSNSRRHPYSLKPSPSSPLDQNKNETFENSLKKFFGVSFYNPNSYSNSSKKEDSQFHFRSGDKGKRLFEKKDNRIFSPAESFNHHLNEGNKGNFQKISTKNSGIKASWNRMERGKRIFKDRNVSGIPLKWDQM